MDRSLARRILAAGLGLGLLAEATLDGPAFGLNVPLLVVALLAAAWVLRRPGRAPDPLDAWLPIVAVVLAGFVAVRGDPFLAFLDSCGACIHRGVDGRVLRPGRDAAVGVGRRRPRALDRRAVRVGAAASVAGRSVRRDRDGDGWTRSIPRWAGPVGRGLLIGIPLALIFAVLFASADPIFRRGLDDVLGLQIDLGDHPGSRAFVLAIAWLAVAMLTVASTGIPAMERGSSLGAAAPSPPIDRLRGLGVLEALVILLVIDAVVAAFVGLQLAYLFGGLDTLAAIGMTYSDYARRGFFELVAAACLAGAVVIGLETTVERRSRPYLAALLGLVGLSAVVLVSAAMRLRLYQDAYGWTELRLYVLVTIVSLGAALVVAAGLVVTNRTRWLGHGLAVDRRRGPGRAQRHRALGVRGGAQPRARHRSVPGPAGRQADLDRAYLSVLPDDAIPVVVATLPSLPDADRAASRGSSTSAGSSSRPIPRTRAWPAWNLGRERARAALQTLP